VPLHAKVLTVSQQADRGERVDLSGPAVVELLTLHRFTVVAHEVVGDGIEPVARALLRMATGFSGLVVTTGGTGFAPSDLTPEATGSVIEREAPGIAEAMRRTHPLGPLSRGKAGVIGTAIVINLPGSPTGAAEHLGAVIELLPHALELLAGGHPH
jgi:molybdenum cofactor synthesis domain-containing protein